MLFGDILCPVDFSAPSRTALRYAANLVESNGQVIVLYVDDPLLSTAAAVAYGAEAIHQKTEEELKKFVADALAKMGKARTRVKLQVAVGKPTDEILNAARRFRARLIVMGTSGASGAARIVLGSTTDAVLRKTEVPVLAVPPGASRLLRRST
jgi:nucleotide-binding universal stress UspA family protein